MIETCPKCRHAAHETLGFCPNMASDNDCSCTHPTPEATNSTPGEVSPDVSGLAQALRDVGPAPGGVMEPDRIAAKLLDHEWFKQTLARKQADANRWDGRSADMEEHATSPGEVRLSTPRTWPENAWPTAAELAGWLSRCTSEERLEYADRSLSTAQDAARCFDEGHAARLAARDAEVKDAQNLAGALHDEMTIAVNRYVAAEAEVADLQAKVERVETWIDLWDAAEQPHLSRAGVVADIRAALGGEHA